MAKKAVNDMTQREALIKTAKKRAKLAMTYAEDGAFASAALILRETAVLFEKEMARVNAILRGFETEETDGEKKNGNRTTE